MAKKNRPPDDSDHPAPELPASGTERDLVTMYARLLHTLENVCNKKDAGREALATRLVEFRQAGQQAEAVQNTPAFGRAFRRLGLVDGGADVDTFTRNLAARMGEAVSRPADQVLQVLTMFCIGDDKLALKPVCGATPVCLDCMLTRECDYFNQPRTPAMALLSPSERLMSGNDQALSDAELLAVLLFGDKGSGTEPVVTNLLARYGRLRALFRADPHEYMGVRDMSRLQATRLASVNALHRRLLAERRNEVLRITTAEDIHNRYASELREFQSEAAVVLLLDQQNNVIRDVWFCDNSPTVAYLHLSDLLRPALREFAMRIALVHNHPSNIARPSTDDVDFTRRLRTACDMVGLGLLDHVIVTEFGYYSFAENGWLGA